MTKRAPLVCSTRVHDETEKKKARADPRAGRHIDASQYTGQDKKRSGSSASNGNGNRLCAFAAHSLFRARTGRSFYFHSSTAQMVGGGGGQAAMSPAPSGGKRGRVPDPEEDVYVDNLHSHKRYLTEVRPSVRLSLSVMRCEHNNFGSDGAVSAFVRS
jgi:hypothetical protein